MFDWVRIVSLQEEMLRPRHLSPGPDSPASSVVADRSGEMEKILMPTEVNVPRDEEDEDKKKGCGHTMTATRFPDVLSEGRGTESVELANACITDLRDLLLSR